MSVAIPAILLVLTVTSQCSGMSLDTFPPDLLACLLERGISSSNVTEPSANTSSEEAIFLECLEHFLWKPHLVKWDDYNITQDHMAFVRSLLHSIVKAPKRSKRQTRPPTGFRTRYEIRRLSPAGWTRLHAGLNAMKDNGVYDVFGNMHSGIVVNSGHFGPNFLGWHRVYLATFEQALRRIDRRLFVPYWDSSLDFEMDFPTDSIMWTAGLLGNGDGLVNVGAFAGWPTPAPLTRNIGGGSRLLSRPVLRRVLSRCRTAEISMPTAAPAFDLELAHGGNHVWVGGQLSGLNTAAHDPLFFMLHAHIDYVWELFRIRQARVCGVNPITDYPAATGLHAPTRTMDRLPAYRNIDGLLRYWTRFWYTYEYSPTCRSTRPTCGTPLLRCDTVRWICVSISRTPDAPEAFGGAMDGAADDVGIGINFEARMTALSLEVGATFPAPPPDPRTQDAILLNGANGRRKRAAPALKLDNEQFGPVSKATHSNESLPSPNGWTMIPIDIFYTQPQSSGGNVGFPDRAEIEDTFITFVSDPDCALNTTVDEVTIYADGITYSDSFSESVLIDKQNGTSKSVVNVGVTFFPGPVTPEVIVSAYDPCGRMCQSVCSALNETKYQPCPGVIRILSDNPVTYSAEVNTAESVQPGNTRLAFLCGSDLSSGEI